MGELLKALEKLAEKLGVAAGELAPHAIAHVKLDAGVGILSCLCSFTIGLILLVVCPLALRGALRRRDDDERTNVQHDYDDDHAMISIFGIAVGVMVTLVSICVVCGHIPDYIEPTGAIIRNIIGK